MSIGKYNFPDHKKGDTFLGMAFEISVNDAPEDLTGAAIKMQLRTAVGSPVVLEFNTEDNSIVVEGNKATLSTKTGAQMTLPAYKYLYDLQVTKNEITKTYVEGVFPIINDVTQ